VEDEDAPENVEIFSESFKQRLDLFSGITKEVLTIKADVEGNNQNQEIRERRERVSSKIEEASSNILKDELQSLESWIVDQQAKLE